MTKPSSLPSQNALRTVLAGIGALVGEQSKTPPENGSGVDSWVILAVSYSICSRISPVTRADQPRADS